MSGSSLVQLVTSDGRATDGFVAASTGEAHTVWLSHPHHDTLNLGQHVKLIRNDTEETGQIVWVNETIANTTYVVISVNNH